MISHKSIGYSGRLGNQLFQYAALKTQALRLNVDCYLPNHIAVKEDGFFNYTDNKWYSQKLELYNCFELQCKISDDIQPNNYVEKEFTFNSKIFEIGDNTSIDGYFQSYKYFDDHRDVILKEFTFKDQIISKCRLKISEYTNPVSIHIRRGDYINHPGFWNITPEYLQESLDHFDDDSYTFLIFSDDIEWCKQVFPNGVIFIEGNNQFEDLCLMSLCNHNVISNSSYSWWAAYLNQNKNKKVVVPSNWFIPAKPLTDLYPSNWIIV